MYDVHRTLLCLKFTFGSNIFTYQFDFDSTSCMFLTQPLPSSRKLKIKFQLNTTKTFKSNWFEKFGNKNNLTAQLTAPFSKLQVHIFVRCDILLISAITILIPRGRAPFGQHRKSAIHVLLIKSDKADLLKNQSTLSLSGECSCGHENCNLCNVMLEKSCHRDLH